MAISRLNDIIVCDSDIPNHYLYYASKTKIVACDLETTGLDAKRDTIETCQVFIPQHDIVIVRLRKERPSNLIKLMTSPSIKKIFHHAVFDLSFMLSSWNISSQNIACTKVASKLLDPKSSLNHSLRSLVNRHLDISLDKSEQTSNWSNSELSDSQIEYAANDVRHLPLLLMKLETQLRAKGLLHLAHQCFDHLPTRAQLDLLGYNDIYRHS